MSDDWTRFKERLSRGLADLTPRMLEEQPNGHAAVLVPVFVKDREPWLLVTLRSQEVSTHKGQISFPGGFFQPSDQSIQETALRETREELGIEAEFIRIAGRFHDYLAITQCSVTPFVAFLEEGYSVTPCSREVDRVVEVPLAFFWRARPRMEWRAVGGKLREILYYDFGPYVIWGLTARIIRDLLDLIGDWSAEA